MNSEVSSSNNLQIEELVGFYQENSEKYKIFLNSIKSTFVESTKLARFVHSTKSRLKSADSLRNKLARQIEREGSLDITKEKLFVTINDLAGFRILHLHTQQMKEIHPIILSLLDEVKFTLSEPPTAKTWDNENEKFFKEIGITTETSESLYTSVHYVVESNSKTKLTAEIQVRTLAEELWGEVDHSINYPVRSTNLSCREQIKVLARVTSSCTRLVDSIFKTSAEGRL